MSLKTDFQNYLVNQGCRSAKDIPQNSLMRSGGYAKTVRLMRDKSDEQLLSGFLRHSMKGEAEDSNEKMESVPEIDIQSD